MRLLHTGTTRAGKIINTILLLFILLAGLFVLDGSALYLIPAGALETRADEAASQMGLTAAKRYESDTLGHAQVYAYSDGDKYAVVVFARSLYGPFYRQLAAESATTGKEKLALPIETAKEKFSLTVFAPGREEKAILAGISEEVLSGKIGYYLFSAFLILAILLWRELSAGQEKEE